MTSLHDFVFTTRFEDLPAAIQRIMERSVLDTLGVAAVGTTNAMGRTITDYVRAHHCAGPDSPTARLLFDGRPVSPEGAALAGAYTIDSIDAHDGHSPVKGHAGSGIFPALLAFVEVLRGQGKAPSGPDFLAAMAVGYEVAYRAGLALHATTPDYHTSGAWTAVGAAAVGARLLALSPEEMRHAIGIAEYNGPRSQMMRCIDHPSNLRDGVGWGSPTGVAAVFMARHGFTGAPAITVEGEEAAGFWSDLGSRWEIGNTHYKRYPVCRWAHPAIDAARDLMTEYNLTSAQIESVRITTFHNATRLAGYDPHNLDELSYGIAYPTATMIVRGEIGVAEVSSEVLEDPEIRRISLATKLLENDDYNARALRGERWADVTLLLTDGRELRSDPRTPKGDPDDPLSDAEISEKFHRFAAPLLGKERAAGIENQVAELGGKTSRLTWFDELLYAPANPIA
ncbi:MmgE/PrpD family protein [Pelagibius sp. Alg239-R121]|uniref:MmgE/PrpD family protein n=1 Tax=Pelagibius sp. Alg239-R121 TaxID=2993448 RepID=UPI0024A77F6A|nr:MmgE/PrpD family protein [Pelagibius sp. Alg239-R121]